MSHTKSQENSYSQSLIESKRLQSKLNKTGELTYITIDVWTNTWPLPTAPLPNNFDKSS